VLLGTCVGTRGLWRNWFDGSFSVKELAAFLFLRAGVGRASGGYAEVFARELAQRFGWSRPTATKLVKALLSRGLLERSTSGKPMAPTAPQPTKCPICREICPV